MPVLPPTPPRLTSGAFPAYSYVPGMHPHPFSSTAGHRWRAPLQRHSSEEVAETRVLHAWAIDLFNHGFYWEAHECWEAVWVRLGRYGQDAEFAKGLIKLAAAGVKGREGTAIGVARHSRRAGEIFRQLADQSPCFRDRASLDLDLHSLCRQCERLRDRPDVAVDNTTAAVVRVMPFVLPSVNVE